MIMLLVLDLKYNHQTQDHCRSFPMFSSRSFIVFHFMFKAVAYFELIFVLNVRSLPTFIYLHMTIQLFQLFVGKTIPSPLNYLYTLVKNWLSIFVWIYFWANTVDLFVLLPMLCCLEYCSFI